CTAAVSANVVLPAPGVATARKSRPEAERNCSRACFCQGRRRTERCMAGWFRSTFVEWAGSVIFARGVAPIADRWGIVGARRGSGRGRERGVDRPDRAAELADVPVVRADRCPQGRLHL